MSGEIVHSMNVIYYISRVEIVLDEQNDFQQKEGVLLINAGILLPWYILTWPTSKTPSHVGVTILINTYLL